jgi:SAM-dependent methyltransferase
MDNNLADKKYWDSGYKNINFSAMPNNYPTVKEIYKNFSKTEDKEIFEIGCFPGRFLYHFGKLGYILNGVDQTDYLEKMVAWFKINNFKIGTFVKDDIFNIKTDKKYDIVFSSGFIEHFKNFEDVIRIQTKLVKTDGYIFITAPNFSGTVQKFLHTQLDKENIDRHNLKAMDVKKWEDVLKQEKFDIIESGYFGGYDFWVDKEKRGFIKNILAKILTHIPPLRFVPNNRSYSPEIILVAKKIK